MKDKQSIMPIRGFLVQELSLSRKKSLFKRPLFIIGIFVIIAAIMVLILLNPQQETADFIKLPPQLETLNVQNAQQMQSLGELQNGALGALHPTDSLMAVSPFERHSQVLNYLTGEIIGKFGYTRCQAFSPDGNTLATCATSAQGGLTLWDIFKHQELTTFVGHTGDINSLAFSPEGKWLASASMDNTIRLWDVPHKTLHSVLTGHTDWVTDVVFTPDGMYLASASPDGTIRIWNTATWKTTLVLTVNNTSVWDIAINPQGTQLAATNGDPLIRLWSLQTGEIVGILKGHTREIRSLAFASDGRLLASTSSEAAIRLWDTDTLKTVRIITIPQALLGLDGINFSPDGTLLMFGKNLSTIEFWGVPAEN